MRRMKGKFREEDKNNFLTNYGVILREIPDLVNVNVSAVAVIELDEDIVVVMVGGHHSAGVKVAQLAAPVNTDPSAQLQLPHST